MKGDHYSYSRVDTYLTCPKKYWYRYIREAPEDRDIEANDPLICGSALHKGMEERSPQAAIDYYLDQFPVISDKHVDEMIKLEILVKRALEWVQQGGITEVEIRGKDGFLGFIDYLEYQEHTQTWRMWDYKYANAKAKERYASSKQMHVYADILAKQGLEVHTCKYLLVPKCNIRQKKTESLLEFRERLKKTLETSFIDTIEFKPDPQKAAQFYADKDAMLNAKEFPAIESGLCRFCEFQKFCKGEEMLPKNERRTPTPTTLKKVWVYGAPFTGKTTLADQFDDPIIINTDGNIKYVTAPYVHIKDEVTQEGKVTNRKMAWQVFTETVEELEKGSEFKTVVVDLLEDLYEHCRLYMYDLKGWEHESADPFKSWDMIRTEFLKWIKRLTALDYNIILISHEDTSKDITKQSGDKITAIKPILQEKMANKVAGMVDIVLRATVTDGTHSLSAKTAPNVFGGGRLKCTTEKIPMSINAINDIYEMNKPKEAETAKEAAPATEAKTPVAPAGSTAVPAPKE